VALIEQYVDSQVAVVTLADGGRGNLLGPEMLRELSSAFDRSTSDPDVRAVINADGATVHRRVIHALALLRQAGIARIAFGAGAEEGKEQ
jgi:biopolymer transport protein ExbD